MVVVAVVSADVVVVAAVVVIVVVDGSVIAGVGVGAGGGAEQCCHRSSNDRWDGQGATFHLRRSHQPILTLCVWWFIGGLLVVYWLVKRGLRKERGKGRLMENTLIKGGVLTGQGPVSNGGMVRKISNLTLP